MKVTTANEIARAFVAAQTSDSATCIEPELKPCPFCGEEAERGFYPGDYDISCDVCEFSISRHISDCGSEEAAEAAAVAAWNRRAAVTDPTPYALQSAHAARAVGLLDMIVRLTEERDALQARLDDTEADLFDIAQKGTRVITELEASLNLARARHQAPGASALNTGDYNG